MALREFFNLSGTFVVLDALPYLKWLDIGGYKKAMKKTAKELDHMARGWLEEHKQKKLCGGIKEHQDFMDVLLSIVTDNDETFGYDVDTIVNASSMVRFFVILLIQLHIYTTKIPFVTMLHILNIAIITICSRYC